jgi:hypothetical protein
LREYPLKGQILSVARQAHRTASEKCPSSTKTFPGSCRDDHGVLRKKATLSTAWRRATSITARLIVDGGEPYLDESRRPVTRDLPPMRKPNGLWTS